MESPSPISFPFAILAPTTIRRSRLKRSIEDGPCPKLIWAMDSSGTTTPDGVVTVSVLRIDRSRREFFGQLNADRYLAIADRVFGKVRIEISLCCNAQRVRQRGRGNTQFRQLVHARRHDDFRSIKRSGRGDRLKIASRGHGALQ